MKRFLVHFALALLFIVPASARKWKQAASGREIDADLIKVEDGKVHLRLSDGRVGQVEVISLSLEDQEYVASLETQPSAGGSGSDWPAFRGPNGDGISPDTGLLAKWPGDGPDKLWVYENAGMGYSGFSVVGGNLFTLGTRGDDLMVVCISTSEGQEVWSVAIGTDEQKGYNTGWGHGPRSTPTVSDGKVYALGPQGTLACVDAANGNKVWTKHLVDDFGGKAGGWGFSESPLIDGDKLIIAPGGTDAGMVALDKNTGRTIWEAKDLKPGKAEYATIQSVTINGTPQYVRLFEKELVGVDVENGDVLWSSPFEGKTAVIPTPIVDGNQIYITAGYGVGCKLVEITSEGEAKDVWQNTTMKNHHGGVVKVGDHLYGFSDGGGLICQDWATGEMVWNEKERYTTKGSVHVAEGKLYALNEDDGTLTLAEASSDGFEQLGQFQLDPQSENRNPKGKVWTHPLVIGGKLFLRDQEIIVCYDVKAK